MNVRNSARTASVATPKELKIALKDARLEEAFEALPPSHQREHASYVAEAKKSETRIRRAQRTVGMIEASVADTGSKPIVVRID